VGLSGLVPRTVRLAVAWLTADGRRSVNAGTGMLGVKQDLGFGVEPLFTVCSPRWIT
jgi:hypothetical protein